MVAEFRRAWRSAEGLVVASWVDGDLAEERAVLADYADVLVGDEQADVLDVVQAAEMAE
jgi:hypothetical protein